ncbi:DUF5686 family protein [Zunongwangia sp. F363]|uniref:DUF5686 family protein n=1 Tax=Autumnicola tepida TaxID=3075595 RepID=A0ABU3CD60_9FLAO|nr:DUF5686 family protein [Zunongwangia sp. F363]MDT0644157.1 DUF5686 family protein [Zunongwangia sp. F363]
MRNWLFLVFIFLTAEGFAQNSISGRIVNSENGEPLPYSKISFGKEQVLTNIDGSFRINYTQDSLKLQISYVGFRSKTLKVSPTVEYVLVELQPVVEELSAVTLSSGENPANNIIRKAIINKNKNDPQKALEHFSYKTYTKLLIDNLSEGMRLEADTSNLGMETIINTGRAYLSEKVSRNTYSRGKGLKEIVLGLETAGFEEPVYEVLSLESNPLSLYQNDYKLFGTDYAAPLANDALKNYHFTILDTTAAQRPAYVIYFAPRREKVVAGLEGVLYLDTLSYAIQQAKAQLLGAIKLEVNHYYNYYPEEDLWFPKKQVTNIRPGSGGKDISVFGGVISVGSLQRGSDVLSSMLGGTATNPNDYLTSTATNYEIHFEEDVSGKTNAASIEVLPEAGERKIGFWEENRQQIYSRRDRNTAAFVDSIIDAQNIERKLEVQKAVQNGYYPLEFWDVDLGNLLKYNRYEGLRIGLGGKTNKHFSERFSLNGYGAYGFKDEKFKYSLGTEVYLNKSSETIIGLSYTNEIREFGTFEYLKKVNDFSLLQPRYSNITYFYNYENLRVGLEHRIIPTLQAKLAVSKSHISMNNSFDYNYIHNGKHYSEYDLAEATLSFLWQPFSRFLHTPEEYQIVEDGFPRFTAQVSRAFKGIAGGDFTFTRLGLIADHQIRRLDQSRTEFILEGNYAFGDLPLTHTFHASPNNANKSAILNRFAVAGNTSFEIMYFNEFFSDRQAMLNIRHQLRPFYFTRGIQPELVLVSRFAIGDFKNKNLHKGLDFKTMDKGFSEVGIELNKIFAGFGITTAYRYGAYHLPRFEDNFSLKFSFQLPL